MDEFSITCTTCSTRLKVRDENLIGQILSCPKCAAMVLVEEPEPKLEIGAAGEVDSQAITRDSIEPDNFERTSEFEERPTEPMVAFEGDPDAVTPPPLPTDWQANTNSGYRQFVMIGGVAIFAIVSAVALFALFVRSSMQQEEVANQTETNIEEAITHPDVPSQTNSAADDNNSPPETLQEPETIETDSIPDETPATNTEPGDMIDDPRNATEPKEPEEREMVSPEQQNPLIEPGERIFGAKDPMSEQQPTEEEPTDLGSLNSFQGLFSDIKVDQDAIKKKKPDAKRIQFDSLPPVSDEFQAPASPVDTVRKRKQRLPGLDITGSSLADTIGIMSDLANVPITIDIQSLDSAGIDPAMPVTGRFLDTTMGDAITQLLAPIGCELLEAESGFLVVRAKTESTRQFVSNALKIDDLANPIGLDKLIQQITLLPPAAIKFDVPDKPTTIVVDGDAVQLWSVALALDAIRISRDLKPRLPADFSSRWLSKNVRPSWERPAKQEIRISGIHERPIGHWIRMAAKSQDAIGMLDWPRAWQNGVSISTKLVPWSSDATVDRFTDEALSHHGLQIFDVGRDCWIVTTPRSMLMTPATVVFAKPIDEQEAEFLQRFADAMGLENPVDAPAVIDPDSKRLICRLPQYLLLQVPRLFVGS